MLNYTGKTTKLGFRNGNLVSATLGETKGEEAFYQVVCWPDGDFCFEAQTEADDNGPGKVNTYLMWLMMDGMRRLDESKAATPSSMQTPLPAPVPAPAPSPAHDSTNAAAATPPSGT